MFVLWSLDLSGIDIGENLKVAGSLAGLFNIYGLYDKFRMKPESKVKNQLRTPHKPPSSTAWSGNSSWAQIADAFVETNPLEKSLVFVDPTETVTKRLLSVSSPACSATRSTSSCRR